MPPGSPTKPGRPPRPGRHVRILLVLLAAMPPAALAQAPPPAPRGGGAREAPLREDPANWWGEVHGWTGSDATRPRAARPPAAPRAGATRQGRASVLTSATARANVRREPSLAAPVLRSMERGSRLTVFGEAPGGWLQVGEAEPLGWIHESALQR